MNADTEDKDALQRNIERWNAMAQNTFWDYLGCEIAEIHEGKVIVTLDIQPHHLNLIGIVHGGVYATLVDSAMGLAAMLARPHDSVVTTNLSMNYVAKAEQGRIVVTAEIIHSSRKSISTQAYARLENGELCAFGSGTFRVINGTG
ncbi:PaaI family thioesterase [Paenibacillus sp. FSL W8-0186]|uniref:Phenylacetic acid degradation-related protein n=1 Tax=Paenibacillus woosongensis TaxID=307580 RepID=A0ABQ4MK31_9BACL|nr:PaaI family thioesterase [Paenibacillus woosongensis]GIP56345.1 phenylacetic acid degradation-related protein [Paenibacillus woosongensis]